MLCTLAQKNCNLTNERKSLEQMLGRGLSSRLAQFRVLGSISSKVMHVLHHIC
jgi:hypothetical protein